MARQRTRWVVLVLLLLGVPWGIYHLLDRASEVERSVELNQLVLPALSLALIVLTLGLAGLLIRNLVKLIVERKRGILGSTLRMKLVFFYLALVLLPAIVLFSGSAQVIKQTVEAILRTPIESLTRGEEVVAEWTDYFREQGLRRAVELAAEVGEQGYPDSGDRARLADWLSRWQRMEDLLLVRVIDQGRTVLASEEALADPVREVLLERLEVQVEKTRSSGAAVSEIAPAGDGLVVSAVAPVDAAGGTDGSGAVVAVALAVPRGTADIVQSINAAVRSYRQARTKRRELVRFYVTLIGLIFLATLFVATWIGLYVARRITEPIQEIAAASREISAGNLEVRVRTLAGDELGMMVDAFNEMAAELQENREVITRSTADLRSSNKALDERRRYIETLVANLSTAVISVDPLGRVTTANPAVLGILGVRLAVGDNARLVFRQHGLEALADLLEEVVTSESGTARLDVELPSQAPTQQVSVRVSPLKGRSGEDLGSLIMVEDLTDLARAQKVLAWHEVARRIAHEIKNPLTPIQLSAQRLRKKFLAGADDLDQVLVESTDAIEREVTGLKQLVDEFSRLARMPQVSPRPVEFRQVVESVLSLYKGLPDISWEVDVDPQVGWVSVDPQQMRRAMINLIDNAVGAVEGRGTIRIAARPVDSAGLLRIEVADSGPGIPTGDRDKMFLPYFSTKKKGTGLGLAIVHKVVTDHRGTIRVEDNDPRGARFVIEIPA